MGTNWIGGGQRRPIELESLFEGSHDPLDEIQVISENGIRYTLTATEATQIDDDQIKNIHFRSGNIHGIAFNDFDTLVLAPFIAVSSLKSWIKERRYFPKDAIVSLPLTPLARGLTLSVDGYETSPLIRGLIFRKSSHDDFGLPVF